MKGHLFPVCGAEPDQLGNGLEQRAFRSGGARRFFLVARYPFGSGCRLVSEHMVAEGRQRDEG